MAVVVKMELVNGTTEQYDQVVALTNPDGKAAPQGVFHVCADNGEGGLFICDVWDSPEAFQAFVDSKIGPAMATVGITERPKITVMPVHNVLTSE